MLRVAELPDLDAQFRRVDNIETLKKLLAIRRPADWSGVIVNFIREMGPVFWREGTWGARAALEFIGDSGGKLATLAPEQLAWLRRDLLAIKGSDDFLWVLRWLRQQQHCDPAIYVDLIRTPSMKRKMETVNARGRAI